MVDDEHTLQHHPLVKHQFTPNSPEDCPKPAAGRDSHTSLPDAAGLYSESKFPPLQVLSVLRAPSPPSVSRPRIGGSVVGISQARIYKAFAQGGQASSSEATPRLGHTRPGCPPRHRNTGLDTEAPQRPSEDFTSSGGASVRLPGDRSVVEEKAGPPCRRHRQWGAGALLLGSFLCGPGAGLETGRALSFGAYLIAQGSYEATRTQLKDGLLRRHK